MRAREAWTSFRAWLRDRRNFASSWPDKPSLACSRRLTHSACGSGAPHFALATHFISVREFAWKMPRRQFDLIVVSELAYYLRQHQQRALADRMVLALPPGGMTVILNHRRPFSDAAVLPELAHRRLRRRLARRLCLVRDATYSHFNISVFQKRARSSDFLTLFEARQRNYDWTPQICRPGRLLRLASANCRTAKVPFNRPLTTGPPRCVRRAKQRLQNYGSRRQESPAARLAASSRAARPEPYGSGDPGVGSD